MINEGFQKIYPFTTENIAGYISKMDIKDKKIFTLGSSCDQALNSLLLGASEVTVFDINEKVQEYYEFKKNLILEFSREILIEKIMYNKNFKFFNDLFSKRQLGIMTLYKGQIETMNLYLQNDENYNKLRNILERKSINFITGNIFDLNSSLIGDKKYDRVILSNVLDYIPKNELNNEEIVYKIYTDLISYLNDNAIIQLYYLYGSMYPKEFSKVINRFNENGVNLELISCDENDSVVFVKKKEFGK